MDRIVIKVNGVETIVTVPDDAQVSVQVDLGGDSSAVEHLARGKAKRGKRAAWLSLGYDGSAIVPDKTTQAGRFYEDPNTGKAVNIDYQ